MNKLKNKLQKIILLHIISTLILAIYSPISKADELSTSQIEVSDSQAQDLSSQPTIYSKCAILMEQETGQILYEHNAYEKTYPASTTKLITAILTLEKCNLNDEVTVTKEALLGIPRSYTTASLQAGEKLSVDQLLHVLLIPSANDAANALACHMAGSVENFSEMMNAKAKEIGCENTHFVNPSGIHDDNHYSTAYDMALIGKYACTFNTIKEIATNTTYSLPNLPTGKPRTFKTTNTLITPKNQYYYEKATGLKTGYTDKAKSCIVSTAANDDMKLLCVILGGDKTEENKSQRELDCKTLFEYGFNNFKYTDICKENDLVDKSKITDIPFNLQNANMAYAESLNLLAPTDSPISSTVSLNSDLNLPIQKGSIIGTATYKINNSDYTVNIIAAEDILENTSPNAENIFKILFAVLIIVLVFTLIQKKKRRRESRYFKRSLY